MVRTIESDTGRKGDACNEFEYWSTASDRLEVVTMTRAAVILNVSDVSVPSKDPWGNERIGLYGTTKIDRGDFGLVWNTPLEFNGVLVGDEAAITVDVEFIKG